MQKKPEKAVTKTIFSIKNLSATYHEKIVLKEINLEISSGKLIAIVGPNGAGKSTLIKSALGLIPKLSGKIEAFGKPFRGSHKKIGYVPQRESVDWDFPVSVFEVVLMGTYGRLFLCQRPGKQEITLAEHALECVGMLPYKERQISQLSGGQQQRTFLARALAQEADLYFMDEPFAGVDAATEQAIIEVLRQLKKENKTVVSVHHNLETIEEYFDEVALLRKELIAYGSVKTTFTHENLSLTYGGSLPMRGVLFKNFSSEVKKSFLKKEEAHKSENFENKDGKK